MGGGGVKGESGGGGHAGVSQTQRAYAGGELECISNLRRLDLTSYDWVPVVVL